MNVTSSLAPLSVDRLHLGGRRERREVGLVSRGPLIRHDLDAHQIPATAFSTSVRFSTPTAERDRMPEVQPQVPPQQGLVRRDREEGGEELGGEAGLVDEEAAVHAGAPQVGGVLGQVDVPQPLHDAVVRPERDLDRQRVPLLLLRRRSPLQARRREPVLPQHLDAAPDGEVVEQVAHLGRGKRSAINAITKTVG